MALALGDSADAAVNSAKKVIHDAARIKEG
jgi:hypothetical protein